MKLDSYMPTEIVSGLGCVKNSGEKLRKLGSTCIIVTSGSSGKKSGALDDVISVLGQENISYTVFDGITQNPQTEDCLRAGRIANEFGAEFIIGIGGGSPLDGAKAVAIYSSNPEMTAQGIYNRKENCRHLPVVLVGTTAGTGSEVTGVSVLTNSNTGMKKSISGRDCYGVLSLCDYGYTMSVPYDFTVSTALDAFAHACESYFSKVSDDLSELYAEKAIRILDKALFSLYDNNSLPDAKLREELYIASLYGGLAINITGTCFPHTVGYVLTEDFGIPHGKASAAFTSEFLKIAMAACPEKAQSFCQMISVDIKSFCLMIDALADVKIKITPAKFSEYEKRWSDPVKNFSRTPGNFNAMSAVDMLKKYL